MIITIVKIFGKMIQIHVLKLLYYFTQHMLLYYATIVFDWRKFVYNNVYLILFNK